MIQRSLAIMKKIIRVKVGGDPVVSRHQSYSESYLYYGDTSYLYPTGSITSILNSLNDLQKKYRDRFQNMGFQEATDCGCPFECRCSPSYVLYGDRYETDIEYKFRLEKEEETERRKQAHELKILEELKRKYE
jgi:hypothetical protein